MWPNRPPAKPGINGSSICIAQRRHWQDRASKADSHELRHWVCVSERRLSCWPLKLVPPGSTSETRLLCMPTSVPKSLGKNGVDNDPGFHSYSWFYTVGKLAATVQTAIAIYDNCNGIQGGIPPANTWFHIAAAWDNATSTVTIYI